MRELIASARNLGHVRRQGDVSTPAAQESKLEKQFVSLLDTLSTARSIFTSRAILKIDACDAGQIDSFS